MTQNPTYVELEQKIKELSSQISESRKSEKALRESKEQLLLHLAITSNMAEGISLVDLKSAKILFTNPRFEQMFGYGPGEMLGQNIFTVNAPTDKTPEETAIEIMNELNNTGEWHGEVNNIKKDGTIFWSYANVFVFDRHQHGKVGVSVQSDINDRKLTDKALSDSEAQKSAILDASIDSIRLVDNEMRIIWANKITETQLGKDRKNMIGNYCYKALTGKNAPCPNCAIEKSRKSGDIEFSVVCEENVYETEGKSYWSDYSVPIKGESDEIENFIHVSRNITEQKRRETEFKKREERFKKIINGSIDGFAITNMDGRIIEVNKAYCQLLGYTRNEILNMSFMDLEADMTKEELNNITLKTIDTGGSRFETKNKKKNGNIIDVEVSASFTPENNGTFLVFIRNITDRKQSEKDLINLNKKLDSKVKKRTNELKRLNDHLILSEDSERKNLASELHDSVAQSLAMAISKIKTIKEVDSGYGIESLSNVQKNIENAINEVRILIHQLHPTILEDFNIDTVIGCLIEALNEKKQIKINYINNLVESVTLIETTKMTIYRAINELLNNILKHSGSSVAEIELSKIKNSIQIRVEDKGRGFEFKTYHQKNYCGFGLYSLSERIENMGGKLIINSSLGKGTKVILSIPITHYSIFNSK